ncbi:hypothetical protein [Pseudonocardia acaciae]|uniref:hypothetical protein n=1 Tax=Pseudonocardia acaciae TaxID=551276 RepID=UPI00048B23BD|nr:hypothetical protein [Pseudonocardia acaciae]
MIRKYGQRAAVVLAATALAASGTMLFGATAFASGKGGQHGSNHFSGGSGGKGGTAQSWCLIPIAAGLGILGNGSADGNSQCNASTSGGSAAPGVSY